MFCWKALEKASICLSAAFRICRSYSVISPRSRSPLPLPLAAILLNAADVDARECERDVERDDVDLVGASSFFTDRSKTPSSEEAPVGVFLRGVFRDDVSPLDAPTFDCDES